MKAARHWAERNRYLRPIVLDGTLGRVGAAFYVSNRGSVENDGEIRRSGRHKLAEEQRTDSGA